MGAAAYAMAVQETLDQLTAAGQRADHMVVASSSGGTQAGMMVGAWAGGYAGQVHGISIDRTANEFAPSLAALANETARFLGFDKIFVPDDMIVHEHVLGRWLRRVGRSRAFGHSADGSNGGGFLGQPRLYRPRLGRLDRLDPQRPLPR